ncbi:unnamed protein product [Linum trigynum]|uniref:Uncharacterized protein n=1 Tax=Linum trigynum TaxID=586398 RepID=A0AAV2EMF4_9ROSI
MPEPRVELFPITGFHPHRRFSIDTKKPDLFRGDGGDVVPWQRPLRRGVSDAGHCSEEVQSQEGRRGRE